MQICKYATNLTNVTVIDTHIYYFRDIIYTILCSMQQIYYIHNVFLEFLAIMEFRGLNYWTDPNCSTNPKRHSKRNTNPTLPSMIAAVFA